MNSSKKPSAADIAAEVGHFRSEAIRQEIASGRRERKVVDRVERQLPAGMQVGRPAFPKDDLIDG